MDLGLGLAFDVLPTDWGTLLRTQSSELVEANGSGFGVAGLREVHVRLPACSARLLCP